MKNEILPLASGHTMSMEVSYLMARDHLLRLLRNLTAIDVHVLQFCFKTAEETVGPLWPCRQAHYLLQVTIRIGRCYQSGGARFLGSPYEVGLLRAVQSCPWAFVAIFTLLIQQPITKYMYRLFTAKCSA